METYNITAVALENQSELTLYIDADESETTDDIFLSVNLDNMIISACNNGYLQAYQDLRDQLLQKGYGLKCVGSKLNAVQSAMASATDKVYLVTLGKQTHQKDLLSLYDYADIAEFPTTKEQSDFLQEWICSLRP